MKEFRIVTIEREYASGGSQVGKLVGQALGIPVYGREILEMAAQEGHTTWEYIEHLEETNTNSLLYSLVAMANTTRGQTPQISKTDQLNLLEGQIITRLAQQGPCVIVGRCAGWILQEREDVLNVFIHSGREQRLRRAVEEYGIPAEDVSAVLHRVDHRRANFYHANTGLTWRERDGYHMVLDSGMLGVEFCAKLLVTAVNESRR